MFPFCNEPGHTRYCTCDRPSLRCTDCENITYCALDCGIAPWNQDRPPPPRERRHFHYLMRFRRWLGWPVDHRDVKFMTMIAVALVLAVITACKEPAPGTHRVPIDAAVDARPWQALIVCQGDVDCKGAESLTICTTRDPACRVVPVTPLDAGAVIAPYAMTAEAVTP